MEGFSIFLPVCAMLYFFLVVFYLTMWSINESLKAAGKNTYSFVIYDGDTRTDKEKIKSEIIYTLFYFLFKLLGFFWRLFWYSMKHMFVFVMLFATTFFIFLFLPSRIIPPQYLINMYTLSILSILNTTVLLQTTKETGFTQELKN